jgi:hypothetical protein
MKRESKYLSRWQQNRRSLIEHSVYWCGRVGHAGLMDVMDLSRAQASKDLNVYINDHPEYIIYDKTAKSRVLDPKFEEHYAAFDPSEYLDDLLSISRGGSVPAADWIVYQPDIMATTVPGRILKSALGEQTDVDAGTDEDWHQTITLKIAPHPGLPENQRRIVELDYAMNDGAAELSVRKCLLFYNLKRLGLDVDPSIRTPEQPHLTGPV